MRDSQSGQFFIRTNRIRAFGLAFGKRRWIENNQIKFALRIFFQPIKRLGLNRLVFAPRNGGIGFI
jgi:hypothetical protein